MRIRYNFSYSHPVVKAEDGTTARRFSPDVRQRLQSILTSNDDGHQDTQLNDNTFVHGMSALNTETGEVKHVSPSVTSTPQTEADMARGKLSREIFAQEHPYLNAAGTVAGALPFVVAATPFVAAGAHAVSTAPAWFSLASSAGKSVLSGSLNGMRATNAAVHASKLYPYWSAGLTSTFTAPSAAIARGDFNPMNVYDVATTIPLVGIVGKVIKPLARIPSSRIAKYFDPIGMNWNNRSELLAMLLGKEGKTWARVLDNQGKKGIVFLNGHNKSKIFSDLILHPQQTVRAFSNGWYPLSKTMWKDYLSKERDMLDAVKQKSIVLNDAQLATRNKGQQEDLSDISRRFVASTIKIPVKKVSPFSAGFRLPADASDVANNVKIISRDKDVSYGGKHFSPSFGTGILAYSESSRPVVIMPRYDQRRFSRLFVTRGYQSPIDSKGHIFAHEMQHQMQLNLPFLDLGKYNPLTHYYEPDRYFLEKTGSGNLLEPFEKKAKASPGSWEASPNEYNAESNAYRIMDAIQGKRGLFDSLDTNSAKRLNRFGLNYDQIESLWSLGYRQGGKINNRYGTIKQS